MTDKWLGLFFILAAFFVACAHSLALTLAFLALLLGFVLYVCGILPRLEWVRS